ncbi:hypothetical protein [Clostridium botulinum]|uniref:hypothetical protein n=1 Tax=Clostridium botulinum TaxID=1491 RepID=UPI0006AC44AE|nr:hypothetical protein [Clostridium botulinum]AWB17234.1 hypothetical protein DB732_07085 [Clostridium botulinum]AWB30026.1 hypothetical protein DBN47_07065 [Clostridium botulinum]EGT5616392.1 hypothetical protein [Clostridium botulinum]EGT5623145.1 hypothetical protein [Clostridium botulinum]EGT5626283.1 hypothetical protein [Clostridium botulinum]
MNENWCILAIAALYERPCTIEQAFEVFDKGKLTKNKKKSQEDIEDMVKFRNMGMTFEEIADIYCADKRTVCRLINSFKKKKIAPCQEHNN